MFEDKKVLSQDVCYINVFFSTVFNFHLGLAEQQKGLIITYCKMWKYAILSNFILITIDTNNQTLTSRRNSIQELN